MIDFNTIKKAYFIGVGGIGMSAIARYFNSRGIEVFGYDRTSTQLTQELENEGISTWPFFGPDDHCDPVGTKNLSALW